MWRVLSAAATAAALLLFVGCGGSKTGSTNFAEQIAKAHKTHSEDPAALSGALLRIGRSQVKAKDTSGAISTLDEAGVAASKITEAGERGKRFADIGLAQISADNKIRARNSVQKAKEAVAKIEDPADKARALASLAGAEEKVGESEASKASFAEAEKIADGEADVSRKISLLVDLAGGYNTAGLDAETERVTNKAIEIAKATEDLQARATSIAEIGAKQVMLKKTDLGKKTFEQAIAAANEITDPELQSHTFIGIAATMGECGLRQTGSDTLKLAEKSMPKVDSASARNAIKERLEQTRSKLLK